METYKIGNAVVRIHGVPDKKRIEESTVIFMKKVMMCRKAKCGKDSR